MRRLRSGVHNRVDLPAVLFEQLIDRNDIADVDVVVLVTANVLDQLITNFPGRGFRSEKLRAHVVVDPDDVRTVLGKMFDRFGTDQTGRACDDDRASHAIPNCLPI